MTDHPIVVRGTEVIPSDAPRLRLQKLARITLDSMVQFVGLLDAEGTVLEINKVALDAVGITLAEVENKPFWTTFWWQVSPEINAELREMIARAAKGEFCRWDAEIFGRAGGKETIIIDASLMPVMDDNGKVVFICAEGRDITEKKAQERLIEEKNIELQGLLERIRELDEIKTQFFANVSHELRTPLALILGPAQRLVDDDGTMSAADRRQSAEVITRNARMLLKHVNDLLDMSRIEAGRLKIEPRETDIAAMVRFVASHFAVLAAERNIEYAVLADEACVAAVDPDKLQRVLMNLLANAFKFVPNDGHVRCTLRESQGELVVSVEDSGSGVKPELRQAIFERFRQGDGSSNRKASGTGLGLAIAKEFVEMHRGRIEVTDSELGGAKFEVSFPVSHTDTPVEQLVADAGVNRTILDGLLEELRPTPASVDRQGLDGAVIGRPRILVVEDNVDMNEFITRCLSRDYEVVSAFDGRDGLEKALQLRPTLVVSDIMMPNVSGDEMIAAMRKTRELTSTPVLLLSAKADEQLKVRLLEDGAQDFIVKPFSEKDLLARVRNLVLAHQAREEVQRALAAERLARVQVDELRITAESANRAKDEFLAMLGHELRNPLSPILGALDLARLPGGAHVEEAYRIIERQVNHLTRLVDDLLDVSRIARGKVDLVIETLELSDVVGKAIEMASPLLEQRGHTLIVDVPRHGFTVCGDAIRLGQVVSNLLTNAAKYTPSGGGRITVSTERVDEEIVLRVKDTGIGIAADFLPRVFELFVQDRQASDRSQGGLGIGLSIVQNLVERHGGSVSATSEGPGRGSEFTIRLPAAVQRATASYQNGARGRPAATPMAKNGMRVLVVDDNEDGVEMLHLMLTHMGYETRKARNGLDALDVAKTFHPHIALLDIGLPVMDGYELAERLRAMPHLAGLYLIAVTGYGQESDRERAWSAGFNQHLVKPVTFQIIQGALATRSALNATEIALRADPPPTAHRGQLDQTV